MAKFEPTVVTTEAEIAEFTRSRDAPHIMDILEKTNAVAIKLDSSWWGSEAFGWWSEWFLIQPDGVSPSGKALFVREGVKMSEPVRYARSAADIGRRRSEGSTGYTSKAQRKFRRKAYHWFDDSKKPGPGMLSTDERDSFKGGSCPLSVIEHAIRTPEPENNAVFTSDGVTEGKMSDGDIRVIGTKDSRYGPKVVLEGDTYQALSKDADNALDSTEWETHHTTFNGNEWLSDASATGLMKVINTLNDAGYSVAVTSELVKEDLSLNLQD